MSVKKTESKLIIQDPLIGSDVEFFLVEDLGNGEIGEVVSAEGLVRGTKDEPFKFDEKASPWFMTSLDNVSYEGNIPPAKTADEFVANMKKLRDYMDASIPGTLKTLAKGSARLDWRYLQTDIAQMYGCSPSVNAWTEEIEQVSVDKKSDLRAAGFHLHFGYKDSEYETNLKIIKACDALLGVPAVLIEPEDERKKVGYGKAGNHRHAPYGVEYRSLSSYFASNDDLLRWCFNQGMKAIDFVNDGRIEEIAKRGDEIQWIINKNSKRRAEKFCKEFAIELV